MNNPTTPDTAVPTELEWVPGLLGRQVSYTNLVGGGYVKVSHARSDVGDDGAVDFMVVERFNHDSDGKPGATAAFRTDEFGTATDKALDLVQSLVRLHGWRQS